ncbi:hypothetical protein BaRGS_00010255, partial [Batillaria attramentaria]
MTAGAKDKPSGFAEHSFTKHSPRSTLDISPIVRWPGLTSTLLSCLDPVSYKSSAPVQRWYDELWFDLCAARNEEASVTVKTYITQRYGRCWAASKARTQPECRSHVARHTTDRQEHAGLLIGEGALYFAKGQTGADRSDLVNKTIMSDNAWYYQALSDNVI